jgi:hypothetical protein
MKEGKINNKGEDLVMSKWKRSQKEMRNKIWT